MSNCGTIRIFADESSTNDGRFLLIGGLWMQDRCELMFQERLLRLRSQHGFFGEMKWGKVSRAKLPCYKDVVRHFFEASSENFIRFNCIAVEKSLVDHTTYSDGDAELGFYKFYYLLLFHRLVENCDHEIFMDDRNNAVPDRVKKVHDCLFLKCRTSRRAMTNVSQIRPTDSKENLFIQVADLMLGAVAGSWNKSVTSPAKLELIAEIESRLGRSLSGSTASNVHPINIWRWRPKKAAVSR